MCGRRRDVIGTIALAAVTLCAATGLAGAQDAGTMRPVPSHVSTVSGRSLYDHACASCHGVSGAGAARAQVMFDDPLPDFRDCQFATREPDADWLAVIHDGGPARAFGRMMPAFLEALTIEQMEDVLAFVRGFCADSAWPRGELNLPRPLVTEKAFPEDEAVLSTSLTTTGTGVVSNKLVYERRLGARNQFEVVVPFAFVESEVTGGTTWGGGVGDLTLGFKRAIAHSLRRGAIFSGAAEIILPVGDEGLGLSKRTPVFEPFLAYGQLFPSESFLQAQAGVELPFDRALATPEAFWRFVVGRSFSQHRWGRTWSPMLEAVAARELESGQATQWDLVPQLQVTLSTRQHIMANVGVRLPVNQREERHPQVMFYFLWDWFDGPLFGGW